MLEISTIHDRHERGVLHITKATSSVRSGNSEGSVRLKRFDPKGSSPLPSPASFFRPARVMAFQPLGVTRTRISSASPQTPPHPSHRLRRAPHKRRAPPVE